MSNLPDGAYAYVYGGSKGVGIGCVLITGDQLTASDSAGWKFQGRVLPPKAGLCEVVGTSEIPAGTWHVGGGSERDIATSQAFTLTIPVSFANGDPFQVDSASGPVVVMAHKASDGYPARFAAVQAVLLA